MAWFFILVTHTQLKNIIWKRNYLLNGVRSFLFASCFYCRYLISQGANVGGVNSEGETPLDIAEEEAMEELLQNEINRQGTFTPPGPVLLPRCYPNTQTIVWCVWLNLERYGLLRRLPFLSRGRGSLISGCTLPSCAELSKDAFPA